MHELSIASYLVQQVEQELAQRIVSFEADMPPRVLALHLQIGALSCVHRDSLLYSFELVAQGTPLEGARLVIESVPVAIYCARCAEVVSLDGIQSFRCPHCTTPSADIRAGRELDLVAIELDEARITSTIE